MSEMEDSMQQMQPITSTPISHPLHTRMDE